MAIPIAYWMLECRRCRSRRVVHDTYFRFVGHNYRYPAPGAGYGGRPLPKRYGCKKGCWGPMRVIGHVFSPDDDKMWLAEPYEPRQMNEQQREEWARLIREEDSSVHTRSGWYAAVRIATVLGIVAAIAGVVFMVRGCGG